MRAVQIARCGLCVALLAVSSAISIPLGPVPFTLQTLALAMLPVALGGKDAVITVALYLLLGGLGLPVFSGFSGGIASIVGPTGGYLWGFLVGTMLAAAILQLHIVPERLREVLAAIGMLIVAYALGTAQLMLVTGMDLFAALAVAVLPFMIPDAIKLVIGAQLGHSVRRATSTRTASA